jgi:peptidoglycan/xylan/chitin deacetylase (PgdA/CDA1 family)
MQFASKRNFVPIYFAFSVLALCVLASPAPANAYSPGPMVSFTFDDGAKNIYENAAPIFADYNIPAVLYAETGPLNSGEDWVMTWQQVRDLQNVYGWEIGSHTINHLRSTQLSDAELENELLNSKTDLINNGLNVATFATPYGDYDDRVVAAAARHYQTHRAAWGGPNIWPYNEYKLISLEGKHNIPPSVIKGWIDDAINNDQWLILLFHAIVPGQPSEYEYNMNDLREVVAYAASKPIKKITVTEGINLLDSIPNLVANEGFETLNGEGWATSWSRTSIENISIDTSHKGTFSAGSKNSVKIEGSSSQNEAISSEIALTNANEYVLSMFHNASNLSAGGFAVWISELDGNMNWLGGKWLGGTYAPFIGKKHYQYNPTSANVSFVKIHLFTEEGSNLTLYSDSVELRAVDGSDPSPNPSPDSGNLINNGSFETQNSEGFASGWTRSNSQKVQRDSNSMGHEPQPLHSLKITGGSEQNIAFSPMTNVNRSAAYTISYYQKISSYSRGGAAMWINEFDGNNVWLSGQWLGGTYESSEGAISRDYTPTSANVAKVELHLFTEADSQLTLFIDEVTMKQR